MEDKNTGKAPEASLPDKALKEALTDQDLEGAAGGYKPMPKHPPKGLA